MTQHNGLKIPNRNVNNETKRPWQNVNSLIFSYNFFSYELLLFSTFIGHEYPNFLLTFLLGSTYPLLTLQQKLEEMVFCYLNCSDLLWEKMFWLLRIFFEIQG